MTDGDATTWVNEQWVEAIAAEFFSRRFAGEPVTLAVDDVSLGQITSLDPAAATRALAKVVKLHGFWGYRAMCKSWRQDPGDQPPPSLPLLGLTVAVASSMTEFKLYAPLRELLGMDGVGMPPGYDETIPAMWEELKWWLDDYLDGQRGRSTVEAHENFPNVGYSLKQALFRGSDRTRLYRFFRSIRLDPTTDEIVPIELRRALAIWARRQGPSAHRLHRLATDAAIEPLADSILTSLAAGWDGRLRDPLTGSRSLPLRLMLTVPGITLDLVAPADDDAPDDVDVMPPDQEPMTLTREHGYFEPIPLPVEVDEQVMANGLELSGDELSFFLDADEVVAFRFDDDLAAWVSTPQISYGERHHLLVSHDYREATESWLAAAGAEGALVPMSTPKLPPGWFHFSKVRVNARPKAEPPGPIRDLLGSEAAGERLRLVGGLRLKAPPRTYLTGGTPNISVPKGLQGKPFELRAEGHEPIRLVASDHEFELSAFDLLEGDYELSTPTATLKFTVIEQLKEHPGAEVGSVATSGGGVGVTGLIHDAAPEDHRPATGPAPTGQFVVLGDGPVADVQAVPRWLEVLDGPLSWDRIDAWVDDARPTWLVASTADGWRAHPLRHHEPRNPDPKTQWAAFIRRAEIDGDADADERALWDRYKSAVEGA